MKKILQISLLILILQVSAYSQDSLRIGWQGELLTTKGKISKMNFYRFVRETDDSIYFLTSGKDNEVYLNSFSRKSKNTDDPILLNPTPLNLPVIKKGELYDPGEATFGGNILLAFKVQSSDMISLTFILLDQQGNLIKNTTIDLPTSGSLFYKENIFLKIVFSQDKKRLLVIHSSCEKDKTIANKLLVFDQDLNQVAYLNNFSLACNPKYTIDKPINTQ
ncbi:MAG: hypothetical protein IT247_05995 [Bacteroidia bacterium]|nr:hypothetical protein [Bacteroidia bacterium]